MFRILSNIFRDAKSGVNFSLLTIWTLLKSEMVKFILLFVLTSLIAGSEVQVETKNCKLNQGSNCKYDLTYSYRSFLKDIPRYFFD